MIAHRSIPARRDRLIASAALAPLCLLMLTALVAHHSATLGERATQELRQSEEALRQIKATVLALSDAESGARGYLLTGNPIFLAPYHAAVVNMPRQLHLLADLVHLDADQYAIVKQLQNLSAAKLRHLTRSVLLRQTDPRSSVVEIRSVEGFRLMADFRATAIQLENTELRYLEDVTNESAKHDRVDHLGRVAIIAIGSLSLVVIGFLLRRLKQFRRMITICAWTHQIKYDGKWMGLEQFFKDSFGFDATHSISEEGKRKFFAKHAASSRPENSAPQFALDDLTPPPAAQQSLSA